MSPLVALIVNVTTKNVTTGRTCGQTDSFICQSTHYGRPENKSLNI